MKAIRDDDFLPPKKVPKSFFRACNAHLGLEDFEKKWAAAGKSPFRFFRSFAHAWHLELSDVPSSRIPGGECFCLGDPHPDNFGVVTFEQGPRYVFNDLDDAGPGRAALDALRYFTALSFTKTVDPEAHLELYEALIFDRTHHRSLPEHIRPSVEAFDRRERERWLDGTGFDLSRKDLEGVDPVRNRQVLEALDQAMEQDAMRVLSVVERVVRDGGSGGLLRLLVLAEETSGRLDLLELKEMPLAAASWGQGLVEDDDRLALAVQQIWRGLTPHHHREVRLGRRSFLLRSRLGRAKLRIEKLPEDARHAAVQTQISILARQHREAFRSPAVAAADLDGWLRESLKVTRRRYEALYARFFD